MLGPSIFRARLDPDQLAALDALASAHDDAPPFGRGGAPPPGASVGGFRGGPPVDARPPLTTPPAPSSPPGVP